MCISCQALIAQDLVPTVITSDLHQDTTYAQYPIYFVVGSDGRYGSSVPYIYLSKVNFYHIKNDASLDWPQAREAQFWRAFCDNQGFYYCPLSDIVTTYSYSSGVGSTYYPSNALIISAGGRTVSMSHFGSTETKNIASFFVLVSLRGVVYYRNTENENEYDVFYYLYLAPATSYGIGVASWYCYDLSIGSGDYKFIPTSNMISLEGMKTYQFSGQFRARITGTDYEIVDQDDQLSLPFYTPNYGSTIVFCRGLGNFYWNSYGTVDKDSTDYPTFNSYDFSSSVANTSNWPFYTRLQFQTAKSNYYLDEFTTFPVLDQLDSDSGGMTDFQEWYQTKHDLLDPDDDAENTEEIDDEKPLPPPEEGESVVDIGKDTVDRYDRYWDDQVGDDEELPEVTPPTLQSLPSPGMQEFYLDQVTAPIQQKFDDTLRDHEFKTAFDNTFDPLGASDQKFTWTINPSINSTMVQMPLPSVTINPSTWIQDPVYGVYFQTFRSCLLLVEFLFFIYKMYKLAVSSLSGGAISADSGGGEDDD